MNLVERRIVKVFFKNTKYNFVTPINGTVISIEKYYINEWFNFGVDGDDMQQCIKVEISEPINKILI